MHLTNPAGLLGNNCYIGSDSEPIELNLLNGALPEFEVGTPEPVLVFNGLVLFDKTFWRLAPTGASCISSGSSRSASTGWSTNFPACPPKAGNETVQNAKLEFVASEHVYPEEP